METVLLVDGTNVLRSVWPNMPQEEVVERAAAWAAERGHRAVLVFDALEGVRKLEDGTLVVGTGAESADDWIAREASRLRAEGRPFLLVTSDRALRADAGQGGRRSGHRRRLVRAGAAVGQLVRLGACPGTPVMPEGANRASGKDAGSSDIERNIGATEDSAGARFAAAAGAPGLSGQALRRPRRNRPRRPFPAPRRPSG